MIEPRRCRWGEANSKYWVHATPGVERCDEAQAYASAYCKHHILQWRSLNCDWQRFINYEKEQYDD